MRIQDVRLTRTEIISTFRLIEDANCFNRVRAKIYPKRRSKNDSHFRRMNKKWLKRYGYKNVPTAYEIGDMIVAHPEIVRQIKERFKKTVDTQFENLINSAIFNGA